MEKHLDLTIRLLNDTEYEVDVYDPESGGCIQIAGSECEYGMHPEFDREIGEEICAWVALMMDERDDLNGTNNPE